MWKTLSLFCCVGFLTCIVSHVTFTNLKCDKLSGKHGEFEKCQIKAVNRTHKYISIYYKLNNKPVNNISMNIKFMRYNSGYKPFFIDVTFDVCKFLRNRRHVFVLVFYNVIKDHSNLNHTCPYDHDLIIDKFYTGEIEGELRQLVPVPVGDYAVYFSFYHYNEPACIVKVYMKITKKQ